MIRPSTPRSPIRRTRHHEIVAETELNVDYSHRRSSSVMQTAVSLPETAYPTRSGRQPDGRCVLASRACATARAIPSSFWAGQPQTVRRSWTSTPSCRTGDSPLFEAAIALGTRPVFPSRGRMPRTRRSGSPRRSKESHFSRCAPTATSACDLTETTSARSSATSLSSKPDIAETRCTSASEDAWGRSV